MFIWVAFALDEVYTSVFHVPSDDPGGQIHIPYLLELVRIWERRKFSCGW